MSQKGSIFMNHDQRMPMGCLSSCKTFGIFSTPLSGCQKIFKHSSYTYTVIYLRF